MLLPPTTYKPDPHMIPGRFCPSVPNHRPDHAPTQSYCTNTVENEAVMAYPPRTQCKVDGCDEPPHVWPNGVKASYCQDHIRLRRARKRDGLPTATGPMLSVLCYLRDMKAADFPFVSLGWPEVDNRTLDALIERDWIIANC